MSIGVRTKLLFLFSVILLGVVAGVGFAGVQQVASAGKSVETLSLTRAAISETTAYREALQTSLYRLMRGVDGDSSIDTAQARANVDLQIEGVKQSVIDAQAAAIGLKAAQATLESLSDLSRAYTDAAMAIEQLSLVKPDDASVALGQLEASRSAFVSAQNQLTQTVSDSLATRQGEERSAQKRATMQLGLATAIAMFVLALTVRMLLYRPIARQIRGVAEAMRAMARGDFAARAARPGTDEIGSLASALNNLGSSMQTRLHRSDSKAERGSFGSKVAELLQRSFTERAVNDVTSRAMSEISPETPMEMLLVEASGTNNLFRSAVSHAGGAAGCSVSTAFGCPAMKNGHIMVFDDSHAAECPKLRDRHGPAVSALCVPVKSKERAIGVLHAVSSLRAPVDADDSTLMENLANQVGFRIADLRQAETDNRLATTDGLTQLRNRRAIEDQLRMLAHKGIDFNLVLADIDHFKQLNDTYGHEQGDRALQHFSRVLESSLREADLCGRFGGEEFVIALPGTSLETSLDIINRFRENLLLSCVSNGLPRLTASFGLVDTTMGASLEDLLRLADAAMYRAKQEGRNRAIVADERDVIASQKAVGPLHGAAAVAAVEYVDRRPAIPSQETVI